MRCRRWIWLLAGLVGLAACWCWGLRVPARTVGQASRLPVRGRLALDAPASSARNWRLPNPSDPRFPYRLANTAQTPGELARSDHGLLLRNALLDTACPLDLPIPDPLRAGPDAGSYIVQARHPIDAAFRSLLERVGATIVAYVPNNAYIVRASADAAAQIAAQTQTQAVLPYYPYFKLDPALLGVLLAAQDSAIEVQGSPASLNLTLLLFSDARNQTLAALSSLGAEILSEEPSPFGPALEVTAPRSSLLALAALPGVQELEPARTRISANDLSRVALGVAPDLATTSDYLGLTGSNVLINVNDSGVDTNQPDLQGRILFDVPSSGSDSNGHGTHIAGIIAGSGSQSLTISNVPGSGQAPAGLQFRGKAPAASIFAISLPSVSSHTFATDSYLQQTAAATKALISNNSWNYAGDCQYDLAAASFDAAVRDALPGAAGSQPLLCVFSAGNAGHGADDGTGGDPDTILSPGTAKNVLTIGAVEQARFITNETWTCTNSVCQTNFPWLPLTDSSNHVAAFSSRGNVGIGTEGEFGRFKPDLLAPGTFILSTRSTQWDQSAYYAQTNDWFDGPPDTNYTEVLSNLNESVGPYYRYESGTSLAAAAVSGTLALMQEFFEQRLGRTNSPALMKALLINGARPLTNLYNLQVHALTNFQGWGLLNLPNSLPVSLTNLYTTTNGIFAIDQSPASALATGQSQTRFLSLSPTARTQPLRVTLLWTDPPGNPVAGIKLVNNLDLVLTNLDNGAVFFGNDIAAGADFNSPWNTATAPNLDLVNNVENVFLAPGLGAHYSVTVIGRRVNVNAVTAQPGAVLQDYALVINSGDGSATDALAISANPILSAAAPLVSVVTNSFLLDSNNPGSVLLQQRVGAGVPVLSTNTIPLPQFSNAALTIGGSNQWHFYVLTNDAGFTNAAFLTFLPQTLSLGQVGTLSPLAPFLTNATRLEADIDLYVSTDPALTNLGPTAIAAADKSLGRGGTETILYSNAAPGLYYVGVKSESQEAAEYAFAAVFSQEPFSQSDAQNNQLLRGFPAPALLPGGTLARPGAAWLFGLAPAPNPVRRVIVTNFLSAPAQGALRGSLTHNTATVVLNNYSTNGPVTNQVFVYDDSGEGDIPGGRPPDTGSLRQFAGQSAFGQWSLSWLDTNQPATNDAFSIFLETQPDLTAGIAPTVLPGACRQDYIYLPTTVTNLTGVASLLSGSGPVSFQVCPVDVAPVNCPEVLLTPAFSNALISVDASSHPPLNPGLYLFRTCNLGITPVSLNLNAVIGLTPNPPPPLRYTSSTKSPILDDAVSTFSLNVTNPGPILSVSVGVRIDHPRVSDLVLHLVSPNGTRVLLDENRGGDSTNGLGFDMIMTNITPVSFSGGPDAVTNVFDVGQTAGTITINYDMYALPDDMRVYYETNLIFDSGLVSNTGVTNLSFGPGASTLITVVMNEGGNANSNTAWFYKLTSTRFDPMYFTFTENTNLTTTPVKFALTPFTNITFTSFIAPTNGIFYLPEESLDRFIGQSAAGQWTLQIADVRAGATNPPPRLLGWQLLFRLRSDLPPPVPLAPGLPWTNLLGPGQIQRFSVATPPWISFASNVLFSATAPVNLLFNQNAPPTGTNAGDVLLLSAATAGRQVLQTNASPPLMPGSTYYLGIQNTNPTTVALAFEVDFDVPNVITLFNGVPFANTNPGPVNVPQYYRYTVSTNAVRAQFEIDAPSADLTLVARKGPPLPSLASHDFLSANPGTNEELIVVFNYSSPVALAPGDWYLAVLNAAGVPAAYSIMATEFPVYGTNILLTIQAATTTNFCITWTSLTNVHYVVQGKAALTDTKWTSVSPTVLATDYQTTYCVPLPSRFHFFRVAEGLVMGFPPPVITRVSASTNGVSLQWIALTNNQFIVEWTPSLAPPNWLTFTNIVTSTNGLFSFHDDGSQTGGLGPDRFYRVGLLPPP